ncbi:Gfo/Idh/MocA family oxidoreductase [Polaromonas sp. P1(28)-13]|nr:Gfo/Idh/MocA family oxidoreductase [Polaromonas sp. P1(28)-13]
MLDKVRPDGVVIASPNKLHTSTALACIERGIPVLVEKPIADSMAEAISIAEASRSSGVPVLVGHHRRYNPLMRRAQEFIREGGIGQMVAIVAFSLRRKHDAYYDAPWKREPGGGPLLINGIHEIDNLRMLCGEIESLQCATANNTRGYPVEDTIAATLKFVNGTLGTLTISDAVQAPWAWELTAREEPEFAWESQNSCMVCGTEASIAIPSLEHWRNEKAAAAATLVCADGFTSSRPTRCAKSCCISRVSFAARNRPLCLPKKAAARWPAYWPWIARPAPANGSASTISTTKEKYE